MKAILHQIQRIFGGFLFTQKLIHQGVKGSNKEEMMLTLFGRLLERMLQSSFQKLNRHRGRKVEHLAASRDLAVVAVVREFSLHQRFAVINAARVFANGVLHILGKERLEPKFTRLVRQIATESHRLVTREKSGKTMGANTQVQMLELDFCHLRFAIRTSTHVGEYSYFYIYIMAKVVQITAENFETEVAQASENRAVAVLFSSAEYPDCAPYSQLLGSLSTSMDFTLGVVSCDERENMQLIQAFRVRSVPEVHIVEKGQIADVIQGVLPEADLKKRLEKFFISDEARFQMALEDAIAQKNFDQALPMLDEALAKTPDDKKLQLLWAKASLGMGDTEKAKEVLAKFTEADDQYREAKSLLELLDFHAEAAKKDVQGKEAIVYHEACKLACAEDFESALQAFLNLYVEAPEWNDGAAKKAMLTLFGVLGPKHELTWKYRAKLNTMMFI